MSTPHTFEGYFEHLEPAGGAHADSFVYVRIEPHEGVVWEQLPARALDGQRFQLCTIPFFAYDLALNDIVRTTLVPGHGIVSEVIAEVLQRSGHETFRAHFLDSSEPDDEPKRVKEFVTQRDGLIEYWSETMIAIDSPPGGAQAIAEFLWDREQRGFLEYETGRR